MFGHIVVSGNGNVVSGQIKIYIENGICLGWVAGTDRAHIVNGVNQLVTLTAINEMASKKAIFFDNCGANMEMVARAKAAWGFPLVPYITLVDNSLPQKTRRFIASHIPGTRTAYHKLSGLLRGGN